ncbi:hypothetical protein KSK37_12175 [Kaistella sp. DKR-2]|uniref:hypothetical protein n=1 Tax=Kaistella soli TaxID=2849654 RepID=UPI001C2546D3|nr:hypothetical protein [Kaistella soli]MBU8883843.1 hypothetical protein [Kaistella soli]
MNLKIKKKEDNNYDVYFEGKLVGKADDFGDEGSEFIIYTEIDILEISRHFTLKNFFKENIYSIIVPIDCDKFHYFEWNKDGFNQIWFEEEKTIVWYIIPDLIKWDKTFTFISFLEKFSSLLSPHNIFIDLKNPMDIVQDGFNIKGELNFDNNIETEYYNFLSIINNELKQIFENPKFFNLNSITKTFNFPEEIRQVCEQYLVYFSKFLEDYGIEISSQLKSEQGETIFTITPKNDIEALQNIHNLLAFYLTLPNAKNLEVIAMEYKDVSVQQLLANIFHLKSQLLLATSMIESKNATIESLKFSNFQKQNFIEEKIIKNEEKTFDGLVSIREFEYKGLRLNLPEIFRRLKRVISKNNCG